MSTTRYLFYRPHSGEITQHGEVQTEVIDYITPSDPTATKWLIPEDLELIALSDAYVVNSGNEIQVKTRPFLNLPSEIILAVGEAETLNNLPAGEVVYQGVSYPLDEGQLTIEAEHDANYDLLFRCFPYRDHVLKVVVHEA